MIENFTILKVSLIAEEVHKRYWGAKRNLHWILRFFRNL